METTDHRPNTSLHLQVHVMLESLDVLRVVALDPLQHGLDLGLHAFHLGLQGVRSARILILTVLYFNYLIPGKR